MPFSRLWLLISSTLVINCYRALIAPSATPEKLKKVSIVTTSALSVVVFLFALNPPDLLQLVITFSMGGMAAAFFFAMLLGCYWKRCNEYGAAASMLGAFVTYLVVELKPRRSGYSKRVIEGLRDLFGGRIKTLAV